MKKSKLFILLPLMTLCLSSCDAIFGSTSSGSSSASSEASKSTSYDSYSLDFTFLYRGSVETASSDASLYFYSDLTDNSFKALNANGDSYRLTLENVDYGSYTYMIYIEYLDSSVSSASPLVDAGTITVDSSASSYSKQVNLNSPLAEILGQKSENEKTDYTYTIEVDNANALSALTYDGNSATQTSVELEINLVTTLDNGNQERTKAGVGDVSLSNYSESVITIDGLTVTPVNGGNTSITISRDGYISTSVDVIVSDITDTGESGGSGDTGAGGDSGSSGDLNSDGTASITLNITIYASDGTTSLKVPDDCVVYIAGDFDAHDDSDGYWWNLDSTSAITLASSDNGVYLYTYETTVTPGYSNYHFKLLLVENGTEYDWYTYTIYDSYFDAPADIVNGGSITLQCITEYTSDLTEAFGDDTGDGKGDDDNPNTGDEGSTTLNDTITLYFTFTYDGNTQTIPEDGKVFINGSWDDANWLDTDVPTLQYDSITGYYYAEVTYDGDDVMNGHWFTYSLFLAGINDDFSWEYSIRLLDESSNLWWSYNDEDASSLTKTETITLTNTFENLLNGDEEKEVVPVDNYTLNITLFDSQGVSQQCPSYGSLYIQSNVGGNWITDSNGYSYYEWGEWQELAEDTTGTYPTYSMTYDNVIPDVYYEFNIIFVYDGESPNDSYEQKVNIDGYNLGVTIASDSITGGSQDIAITNCYTLAEQYPEKTSVNAYTLVFTLYDANGEVQTCPDYGKLQIQGEFDGTLNDGGWIDWGSYHDLSQTIDTYGNVAYEVSFSDLVVDTSYEFNIVFFYNESSLNTSGWPTISSSNFSVTITGEETNTQYVDLTGCYTLASRYTASGIDDSDSAIDITIAIKDSGSTSKDFSIYSNVDSEEHAMIKADNTSSYSQYYTYRWDKNSDMTWNIHQSGETGYTIDSQASTGLGNGTTIGWSDSNYHLWASYKTWGLTLSTLGTSTDWENASSLTVILTFNFGSYSSGTTDGNWLVSGFSFILA